MDQPTFAKLTSIHTPARDVTCLWSSLFWPSELQSTHPRGLQRKAVLAVVPLRLTSIHAPVRDVTLLSRAQSVKILTSIHTPAKDATLQAVPCLDMLMTSIHTPAKDATANIYKKSQQSLVNIDTKKREIATRS